MKKFLKIIGGVAGICAGVAGGLFIYSKIRKNKCDEIEELEDYDDDFSDEETTGTEEAKAED